MKLVFMGTPEFSVPALQALVDAGHDVIFAYTQPPRPAGRGKRDRTAPVHRMAETLGIPVRHPASFKCEDAQDAFRHLDADMAVVVAYGLILPQAILDAPHNGCLNIHASLLPRWRGAAPIHRAIMAGDTQTGVTIMQMEACLDTGPELLRGATSIAPQDTTGDLHDRLSDLGAQLIIRTLANFEHLTPTPQSEDGVTYANKIDKSEARIDWTQSARKIDRLIRGLSPFPGAWCDVGGERVKLLRSRLAQGSAPAGTHFGGFRIACGDGAVQILSAQRQGKRPMIVEEILHGITLPSILG